MESEKKKSNKGLQVLIIILVIALGITIIVDLLMNYVPLKDLFTKTVNYNTQKEVTVTDKGIADAVEKLFNVKVLKVNTMNIDGKKKRVGDSSLLHFHTTEKKMLRWKRLQQPMGGTAQS